MEELKKLREGDNWKCHTQLKIRLIQDYSVRAFMQQNSRFHILLVSEGGFATLGSAYRRNKEVFWQFPSMARGGNTGLTETLFCNELWAQALRHKSICSVPSEKVQSSSKICHYATEEGEILI